jgi:hypothetical protein
MDTLDPPFLEFWKRTKGSLPETIGEVDLSTLNSALGVLFARLRYARGQFENEGDNGRGSAFTALGAFHMFITLFRIPLEEALHIPIVRLQDALAGLEQNRREPILKPIPRSGRAPSSGAYASLKGHAAATVQLLVQVGLTLDDARREVATVLSPLVRPDRGKGAVTATTVRTWSSEVSSDVGRHGLAALMYDDRTAAKNQARFSALPKDQAKQLALRELADWVQSTFPAKAKLLNPPS